MRFKKSFRLLIATLLLLTVLLTSGFSGCGSSSDTEVSNTDAPSIDSSRFTCVEVEISGDTKSHFSICYIITDTQTGNQFLYTYHDGNSYDSGATMVKIGTLPK